MQLLINLYFADSVTLKQQLSLKFIFGFIRHSFSNSICCMWTVPKGHGHKIRKKHYTFFVVNSGKNVPVHGQKFSLFRPCNIKRKITMTLNIFFIPNPMLRGSERGRDILLVVCCCLSSTAGLLSHGVRTCRQWASDPGGPSFLESITLKQTSVSSLATYWA